MAGKITYSNLYTQIKKDIDDVKRYVSVPQYTQQTGRSTLMPMGMSSPTGNFGDLTVTDLVNAVQDVLSLSMPPIITEGLTVEAISPPTNVVKVKAGKGSVGGTYYELASDTNVNVSLDLNTQVWYVMLWKDGVTIETNKDPNKLPLAKIIAPQKGKAAKVIDKRDGTWDAYIVNFTDYPLHGDAYGNLEEDSIDLLKNNIGDILADNIVGNLTLSENLKIVNTNGSLVMDSTSIKMLSENEVTIAKFNRKGTFFYDDDGIEIAKFSVDGAKIGNILVTKNSIESGNYVSGYNGRGFKIGDDGNAEFSNVIVRGELRSSVFRKDEIHVSGGDLLVTNGTILSDDVSATDTTIEVKQAVFDDDDIIYLKNENQAEHMKVTGGGGTSTLTVTRNFDGASGTTPETWTKGEPVVEWGDRVAIVTSGDLAANTPYIDVIDRYSQNAVACECTYARLGNLAGITDANFGGALDSFGLYSTNVYLTGCLFAPNISTANSGSRVDMNTECFYAYDGSENKVFQMIFGGTDAGDVVMGNTACQYVQWDNSEGTFKLLSDNGTNCVEIQNGTVNANEMYLIDPACNCNYSYLSAGQWYFHDTLGNITPYPKRICNGNEISGATVELCGWVSEPKLQVGIKELRSYDSGHPEACQNWCIYYDNLEYFCTNATCWGWCFDVHAFLALSAGAFEWCIQDVADDTAITTHDNTCCTDIRTLWNLYCYCDTSSTCYGYGTVCYKFLWRCDASGCAWTCTADYEFTVPHSTLPELQACHCDCKVIDFTSAGTYEVCLCVLGNSWTLSTFSGLQCCLCTRAANGTGVAKSLCICCTTPPGAGNYICYTDECTWQDGVSLAGTDPSNVYCTYLCWNWVSCGLGLRTCGFDIGGTPELSSINCARLCVYNTSLCLYGYSGSQNFNCCCTWTTEGSCVDLSALNACSFSELCMCTYGCVWLKVWEGVEQGYGVGGICENSQYCACSTTLYQCYCALPSNVTTNYCRLYANKDYTGAITCLDSAGIINWLAISFS